MTYIKKNYENNAECGLEFGFNESSLIFFGTGAYDRFATSDFIVEITTFDPAQNNKVINRENIFCTSRSGNQFNVGVLANRAYEAVPIDDDQTTNIQQALVFEATNTVIRQVWSKKSIDDIQDELVNIPTTYATKQEIKEGSLVYNASSTGDDDYNITITGVTSYIDGATYRFKADVDNNGTATFEVNSLGAIDLKKNQGQEDLVTGDIKAGGIVTATYNSTLSCFQFTGQDATVINLSASQEFDTINDMIPAETNGLVGGKNPVFLYRKGVDDSISQLNNPNVFYLGYDINGSYEQGQTITGNGILTDISINMRRQGTPNFILSIEVYNDSDVLLGTSTNTLDTSTITTASNIFYSFSFNNIAVSGSWYYKINIVSGTVSTSNYVRVFGEGTGTYDGGYRLFFYQNGTKYESVSRDIAFKISLEDKSKIYKDTTGDLLGLYSGTTTADTPINLIREGVYTHYETLLDNTTYYITPTGELSTSASGNTEIGKTISTTKILLTI